MKWSPLEWRVCSIHLVLVQSNTLKCNYHPHSQSVWSSSFQFSAGYCLASLTFVLWKLQINFIRIKVCFRPSPTPSFRRHNKSNWISKSECISNNHTFHPFILNGKIRNETKWFFNVFLLLEKIILFELNRFPWKVLDLFSSFLALLLLQPALVKIQPQMNYGFCMKTWSFFISFVWFAYTYVHMAYNNMYLLLLYYQFLFSIASSLLLWLMQQKAPEMIQSLSV